MDPVAITQARSSAFVEGFFAILPQLLIGVVALALFWAAAALAGRLVRRVLKARGRPDLGSILGSFLRAVVIVAGFLVASAIIFPSIQPVDILTALGFGSVAIGFAFKDILQNWVSGLLILMRQPFARGDQIRVKEFKGTVEHIDSRATFIRTYDARRVIIPNRDVYTNPTVVMTTFDSRRDEYDVGIGYGDDVERACALFLDAMRGCDHVIADPPPEAIPRGLAASAILIRLRWWSKPRRAELVETRGEMILAVRKATAEAGIDLPFDTQVMLVHDQTEETDGDRARQREGWPSAGDDPGPRKERVVRLADGVAASPAPVRRAEG